MAKSISVVVSVAAEYLGAIITALQEAGVPASFAVGNGANQDLTGAEVTEAVAPKQKVAGTRRNNVSSRTVYTAGRGMTVARVAKLEDLSVMQRTVAAFILKHDGKVGMRDVQDHFDGKINPHTVDGTIYQLRKRSPAVIVSKSA